MRSSERERLETQTHSVVLIQLRQCERKLMLGVSALMAPLCLPCFLGPRPKVASTTHSTARVISTQHTHHAEEGVSNALEQSLIGLLLLAPSGLLCKVAKGRQRKSGHSLYLAYYCCCFYSRPSYSGFLCS